MKVILTADVPKVGKRGEVVDVKSGYAHNFLFKNDVAVEATKGNLKKLAEQQAQEAEERAYEKAQAEGIASTLNDKQGKGRGQWQTFWHHQQQRSGRRDQSAVSCRH